MTSLADSSIIAESIPAQRVAPDVSVVIATHAENNWAGLMKAVDSVRAQRPCPPRIVVSVDHNPTLSGRLRADHRDLVVVDNQGSDRGASGTRNAGAAVVDTEFLAFLDDDEVAEPEWLEELLAPFGNPDVVGTGGRYAPMWEVSRPAWFPDELAWVVGGHHSGMPTVASPVRNVWSGNMAVRTSAFRRAGGFRADFGKVGKRSRPEDTDLCIRVASGHPGSTWMYLPEAKIHHNVPAERSSLRFFLLRCYSEGRGKVELSRSLPAEGTLDVERLYLRRTIPHGVAANLREASAAAGRAMAIVVGVMAAGTGATVSAIEGSRRDHRRAS